MQSLAPVSQGLRRKEAMIHVLSFAGIRRVTARSNRSSQQWSIDQARALFSIGPSPDPPGWSPELFRPRPDVLGPMAGGRQSDDHAPLRAGRDEDRRDRLALSHAGAVRPVRFSARLFLDAGLPQEAWVPGWSLPFAWRLADSAGGPRRGCVRDQDQRTVLP
ncbi:hypothetical protein D9M68_594140 [compost metagenome]